MKTFKIGGIHPPATKLTARTSIKQLPLPEKLFVPLDQHIGAPVELVVERGEEVKTGQLIARPGGFVSAALHAPAAGKIQKIDNVIDASGYKRKSVIIKTTADSWHEDINTDSSIITECSFTPGEIINKIKAGGITGMGGASFPTHVKLSIPEGKKIDTLLINGAECEPYLTADQQLMLTYPEKLITGIKILQKALNVKKAYIGIEINKPQAIAKLRQYCQDTENIAIIPLKLKYPQGAEKQLIKAILNREVPAGGLPLHAGCVVQNVGTAVAVYEAVQKNKPLIERLVTVSGKNLSEPSNFLVRIGTPVAALIEACGGLPPDTGKIISGGPMMGKALISTDVPVTKGTSGIVLLPARESRRRPAQNCIRCGKCIRVCPTGVEAFYLEKLAVRQKYDEAAKQHVTDCMECGSCSYTCPSSRPLLDYIRLAKNAVIQKQRKK